MIDAIDGVLGEHFTQTSVQLLGRLQVPPKRLLDDHPSALETERAQAMRHQREQTRWNRQIVERMDRPTQLETQSPEGGLLVVVPVHVVKQLVSFSNAGSSKLRSARSSLLVPARTVAPASSRPWPHQ